MKTVTKSDPQVHYQLKNGWKLKQHQKEKPKGESLTVPDESYTIQELIRKYASGLDPGISKLPNFNGEDDEVDFDDPDLSLEIRQDITDQAETLRQAAERQKRLLEQMEEAKQKASQKKTISGDVSDDLRNEDEEENTPKSRKYEKPKKGSEGATN